MQNIFRLICLLFLNFIITPHYANATFSIIAIDKYTNETGSALGTCYENQFKFYAKSKNILLADYAVIENNGFGIMNIQSDINDFTPIWLATAKAILAQDEPYYTANFIMKFLTHPSQDKKFKERQILMLKKDMYMGITADIYHGTEVSDVTAGSVKHLVENRYSIAIAGNLLSQAKGIARMEAAFLHTKGNLADKLIAAIYSMSQFPDLGDRRCRTRENVAANYAFIRTFTGGKKLLDLDAMADVAGADATVLLQEKYKAWQHANYPNNE